MWVSFCLRLFFFNFQVSHSQRPVSSHAGKESREGYSKVQGQGPSRVGTWSLLEMIPKSYWDIAYCTMHIHREAAEQNLRTITYYITYMILLVINELHGLWSSSSTAFLIRFWFWCLIINYHPINFVLIFDINMSFGVPDSWWLFIPPGGKPRQ